MFAVYGEAVDIFIVCAVAGGQYMGTTEYLTIKVPKSTKVVLDRIKISQGLPSYAQAIRALAEKHRAQEEIITEFKRALAEEATKVILNELYKLVVELLGRLDKSPSEITLAELMKIARSLETGQRQA